MYVVNFFGAPCTGKSTMAADVFQLLKKNNHGYSVELATEVAKDLCYEGSEFTIRDQLYIAGQQHHRLYRLKSAGVDIAVTDAPIMLQSIYYDINALPNLKEFESVILGHHNMYLNINFMLYPRSRYNYDNSGRNYNFEDQDRISGAIIRLLDKYGIDYISVTDDIDAPRICKDVFRIIENIDKSDFT